ncbi:TPA: hypothetical protein ACMD08_004549 [Vibrio parahaemolyticus]|uniref:hypothetical protein n=2 Tax=Vibrio parahaemolyticus TaxID=670 RepID=UPI00111CE9F1|nr:hypothetical protein [Vibrio parahaemolyticus]EHR5764797.1 hypothetical protein [Vibrio parahaemolyticus]EHY0932083.1 hypothetical protein [Vibrio parahaemolyticus]EJC6831986.1 hypothetical protein [Vibrio parahaemolyticus]ELA9595961.1 hypothetical protein [Vibrio parahaemolyticus]MDF4381686.1 hypothetical protein [Vibrio parahaemolyticus]
MKECFIVTPIGAGGSSIRREIDGLIQTVFTPVVEKFDLKAVAAHQISESGSITRQVVKRILEADLVIANLTNLNPNVMYELGIRHSVRKPTIVVAREDVVLPFDLSDERTIFYKNDISGVNELKDALESMIPLALEEDKTDNPVYRVVDVDLIKIPEGATDSDTLLNSRLSQLENQLEDISRILRQSSNSSKPSNNASKTFRGYTVRFSIKENQFDDFSEFCAQAELAFRYELVYKDSYMVEVTPDNNKQLLELQRYVDSKGIQRI